MKIDDVEVTRMQAVELRPTDVLVVEVPQFLTSDAHGRAYELIKEGTKHPGKVLILHGGATLNIIRPMPSSHPDLEGLDPRWTYQQHAADLRRVAYENDPPTRDACLAKAERIEAAIAASKP